MPVHVEHGCLGGTGFSGAAVMHGCELPGMDGGQDWMPILCKNSKDFLLSHLSSTRGGF